MRTTLGNAVVSVDTGSAASWSSTVQQAAERVKAIWPASQPQIPIRVIATDADFDSAVTDLGDTDIAATSADGILLGPRVVRGLTHEGQVEVLAHEMTHWELRQYGSSTVPLWVREGLAQWSAEHASGVSHNTLWPHLRNEVVQGRAPEGPPSVDAFNKNAGLSYETSSAFVEYLFTYAGMKGVQALSRVPAHTETGAEQWVRARIGTRAPTFNRWLTLTLK